MDVLYYLLWFLSIFFLLIQSNWFVKKVLAFRYYCVYLGFGFLSLLDDAISKKNNVIEEYPDKEGEVAIVTGGASGIGLGVVKNLLKCKMHVIMAEMNVKGAEEAIETLKREGFPGTVSFISVDMSSIKSVKKFCKEFKEKHQKLNILVNNAGINFGEHRLTDDGFETILATNYLGHFYMTHLLLPNLIATGKPERVSRIVNVASCAHYGIHMFFDDFQMKDSYHSVAAYGRSKLGQVFR
jgi:NAD(P)-dependent dehydrogenase (short-subunit alcohol dehydrogenase family)